MIRKVLVVLAVGSGVLVAAPAAQALTAVPVWQCRGSATYTSVSGNNRVEPVVANGNINTANGANPDHAQCAPAEAGAGNTATQIGIPQNLIGAASAGATTTIAPEIGRAIDQKPGATAKVENLSVQIPQGGTTLLGVAAASSSATGTCTAGSLTPVLSGTSQVATVTLGGGAIPLDGVTAAVANLLTSLGLDPIVKVTQNEQIRTATSLTVRALHVVALPKAGGAPLLDLVVAESKIAANGPVCDPTKQGDPPNLGQVCPAGSVLDTVRTLCVIPAGTGGSSLGEIIVGSPFSGPSGGTVIPLDVARKTYGKSPCLGFGGAPKFAIVGTNKADRITGTNVADRILGLGGNDKIDGGRGNDCLEGNAGGDSLSGGLGNDKTYGSTGKDHLNGGPGTDYESAGSGNDTINAAFGKDRALGGTGRDFINVATAGPPASVDCGPGPDKVRINTNERRRVKHCEVIHVFTTGG